LNTRREFLQIGLSAAISADCSVSQTSLPNPNIKHVIVLILENRSFDHMLAYSRLQGTEIPADANKEYGCNGEPVPPSHMGKISGNGGVDPDPDHVKDLFPTRRCEQIRTSHGCVWLHLKPIFRYGIPAVVVCFQ
jgi:phospholipase C